MNVCPLFCVLGILCWKSSLSLYSCNSDHYETLLLHCQQLNSLLALNPTALTICLFLLKTKPLFIMQDADLWPSFPSQLLSRCLSAVSGLHSAVLLIWCWTGRCSSQGSLLRGAAATLGRRKRLVKEGTQGRQHEDT